MLKTLQLKDIFVGKTDAKNEFIENSIDEQSKFIDSYLQSILKMVVNIMLQDLKELEKQHY